MDYSLDAILTHPDRAVTGDQTYNWGPDLKNALGQAESLLKDHESREDLWSTGETLTLTIKATPWRR